MADEYTRLARASFETYVKERKRLALPSNISSELLETKAGCFVSLHSNTALRGCIGTLGPTQPTLAEEIIENAISACSRDPRFPAVTESELPDIHCSVDVLGQPESIQGIDQLDVVRYGVIVSKGFRRGVLLPDLEGVDTPEQQVAIAKSKAGIGLHEACALERFEVVRHEE